MNNAEFQQRLEEMCKKFSFITNKPNKTVNELLYVLRMDEENDYNISLFSKALNQWTCIPSVKECFVPVKTLAKHVKEVRVDEDDDFQCKEICLTVIVEE